jgi:hypothetical protein
LDKNGQLINADNADATGSDRLDELQLMRADIV